SNKNIPVAAVKEKVKPDFTSSKASAITNNFQQNIEAAAADFNFDSIIKKWESFAEAVSNEKSLILGPFIKSVKVLNLEGNKLNIASPYEHGKELLNQQNEYITKKAMDFFGKKLIFELTEAGTFEKQPENSGENISEEKPVKPKKENLNDPFENYIINEMGGEEF